MGTTLRDYLLDSNAYYNGIPSEINPSSFDLATELATRNVVFVPPGTHIVSAQINISDNKKIYGIKGLSILQAGADVVKLLNFTGNNSTIDGLTIIGTGPNITYTDASDFATDENILSENNKGTKYGIYLNSRNGITINNCEISNFDYVGLFMNNSGSGWIKGNTISNIYIHDCYEGFKGGIACEYSTIINLVCNNNKIGGYLEGGNMLMSLVKFNKNVVGFVLSKGLGTNDGHGSISLGQFNHCTKRGFLMADITLGFSFDNCQFWSSGGSLINTCAGIIINNSQLNYNVTIDGGVVSINNCQFKNAMSLGQLNSPSLFLKGNFYLDGSDASAINN